MNGSIWSTQSWRLRRTPSRAHEASPSPRIDAGMILNARSLASRSLASRSLASKRLGAKNLTRINFAGSRSSHGMRTKQMATKPLPSKLDTCHVLIDCLPAAGHKPSNPVACGVRRQFDQIIAFRMVSGFLSVFLRSPHRPCSLNEFTGMNSLE
jgi:hypothetical protein